MCMYGCVYAYMIVGVYVCLRVCMHDSVCVYIWMCVCMHGGRRVCMDVFMYS